MASSRTYIPPFLHLIALVVIGALAFFGFLIFGLQPSDGWTWDVSQWRPLTMISGYMRSELLTGLIAYMISAWVWSLKPTHPSACLFAASGLMTLIFCFAATASQVAIPISESTFWFFAYLNMAGASGFGIVMICLFLIYPSRLPAWRSLIGATVLGFGGWTLASMFGPFKDYSNVQLITLCEMILIIVAVIWQVWAARHDPRQRAIAVWLGVATILGSGGFIFTVAAPSAIGFSALIPAPYAFAFFLLIYFGLAVGLMRYRLFDLGVWAYRLGFYVSAAVLMIVIDIALVSFLSFDSAEAIGISLLITALVYLPLRDFIWRKFVAGQSQTDMQVFSRVLDAALEANSKRRAENWQTLLKNHFHALEVTPVETSAHDVEIGSEGLSLYIPPVRDATALHIDYPQNGRALFSPDDVAFARHIVQLMQYAGESRDAYDRGVAEERTRIARDIHDNIGAQLMRALHSERSDRKDTMIRETLADLRDVINNAQSQALPLDDVLADLRAETADRLEPHNITLDWTLDATADDTLMPGKVHALRSFIREAASNVIKHSNADALTVKIDVQPEELHLVISDNGTGFDIDTVTLGQGLGNMKARVEGLGGQFSMRTHSPGVSLIAILPRETVTS